jgi:alanyl-tRNA synthetase
MGEMGPCGPCSEIHIDSGIDFCNLRSVSGHVCAVNGDCHRYIELWNLVFIQFQRNADKSLTPLKDKFVDTGAGFERICQVLQNVKSNYETDIFQPIIKKIENISGMKYHPTTHLAPTTRHDNKSQPSDIINISFHVIADHIRSLTFSIADGGIPSNEGRGYVIRRILRRAARYGRNINLYEPFLYKLVDCIIENMGEHFTELHNKADYLKNIIKSEEERFNMTLDKGLAMFEELANKLLVENKNNICGIDAFTLYDTFGFPLDLTKILADEKGLTIDEDGFHKEMELQKQRARDASSFKLQNDESVWTTFRDDIPTEFVGYNDFDCEAKIIRYAILNTEESEKNETEPNLKIILDKTPFYAESGGQVADIGQLLNDNVEINILNVQKEGDFIVHYGYLSSGSIKDEPIVASIDIENRDFISKNHTATHLLHSALKEVLGEHVQQKGSLVNANGFRFDFIHFSAMTDYEIMGVEYIVNEHIMDCFMVTAEEMSIEQAKEIGAVALFGEKYGNVVRVVNASPTSKELCGGTHTPNTGNIGLIKIISEYSSSAGVRRIEAITGQNIMNYITETEKRLKGIYKLLSANKNNLMDKIEKLIADNKNLSTEVETLKLQNSAGLLDDLINNKIIVKDQNLVYGIVNAFKTDDLKTTSDRFKEKIKSGIGVFVAQIEGKVSIVVVITPDLTDKLSAGKIVSELAPIVEGRGGGKPDMAMAGGKAVEKINELIKQIPDVVSNCI